MGDYEEVKNAYGDWFDYGDFEAADEFARKTNFDWGLGFYGGYHSRDEEIAALKAEIERKDEAIKNALEVEPVWNQPLLPHFERLKEILRHVINEEGYHD